MSNIIKLDIRKDLTKLAGNSFGRQVYASQVKDKINLEEEIVIIIPERIDRIATSFIQGFFSDIVSVIGISGVEDRVKVVSSIPDINKFILENLER